MDTTLRPAALPDRILVIEDDADARANFRDILELDDYKVETAGSVDEVHQRQDWSAIATILLDRRLPDGRAEDLLPWLRRRAPQADVVIITGYTDLDGALVALRQGAADYLLKPVHPDALRATLDRLAEHRRLLLAKQSSDAVFQALVEAAPCMIAILKPGYQIHYLNPHARKVTGYSVEEAVNQDLVELLLPKDLAESDRQDLRYVLEELPAHGYQGPIQRRDGSRAWLLWQSLRLPDLENGSALLVVGHDITSLKGAQDRALRAERLATIGQMLTVLAHESRSDLQAMRWYLDLLKAKVEDPEARQLVERIGQAGNHLEQLYGDVRNYAAPITLERSDQLLPELLLEAWDQLAARRQDRCCRLDITGSACDAPFPVDRGRLTQVLRNILENALDACEDDVELQADCQRSELEGRAAIQLRLRDNGPGLNGAQRDHLFEPFYTTKTQGTGLGLAIARRIAEAHGGRLFVGDSGPRGTTLVLVLPLSYSSEDSPGGEASGDA